MRRITPALAVGASLVLALLLESCRLTPEDDAPKETDEPVDVPTDEPADVPLDVSEPYETLKTAVEFSPSCTGFSRLTPPQMCAFRDVLRYPEADDLFKRLVEEGTTAGQLYGLSGVYFTNLDDLPTLIEGHIAVNDSVLTQAGCVVWMARVGDLLGGITSGWSPLGLRDSECADECP